CKNTLAGDDDEPKYVLINTIMLFGMPQDDHISILSEGLSDKKSRIRLRVIHALLKLGNQLGEHDAEQLERTIGLKPDRLDCRILLLGYYFLRKSQASRFHRYRQSHVLWIIENCPGCEIHRQPEICLHPANDAGVYSRAKEMWLQHVVLHCEEEQVLS